MTFVVFDVETTGKEIETSQIIEITGKKYDSNFNLVDTYTSLIRYSGKLSKDIVQLTNITDQMLLEQGRDQVSVMHEFREFIRGGILVAHNAFFDLMCMYKAFRDLNIEYEEHEFYCTLYMSRILVQWIDSHKLNVVCSELGIQLVGHHRSENDVEATTQLFILLYRMMIARKRDFRNRLFYVKQKPEYEPPKALHEEYIKPRLEKIFF